MSQVALEDHGLPVMAWFIFVAAALILMYVLLRAAYLHRRRGADRPSEPVLHRVPAEAEQAFRGGGAWQWVRWDRATLTVYARHVEILAPQGMLGIRTDIVLPSETATMRLDRHGPFGLPLAPRDHIRLIGRDESGRRQEFMLAPKDGFDRAWQALLRSGVEPLPPGAGGSEYYGASWRVRAAQAVWTGVWAIGVLAATTLRRREFQGGSGLFVLWLFSLVWLAGAQLLGWLPELTGRRAHPPAASVPFEPTPELAGLQLAGVLVFIAVTTWYVALQNG